MGYRYRFKVTYSVRHYSQLTKHVNSNVSYSYVSQQIKIDIIDAKQQSAYR